MKIYDIYKILLRRYGPQGWWPGETQLEIIVGAILTQNTSWTNVEKAIADLKEVVSLDSPTDLHGLSIKRLSRLIRPAGYYNVKARRIKNFTQFLEERYGSSIKMLGALDSQRLREELLSVNGIGPETCDSIMLYAFNRAVFVIDAYTKRIFSRHGYFTHDILYESAQRYFMNNLPAKEKIFNEYHALIVRLAKEHCRTNPRCDGCPLSSMGI